MPQENRASFFPYFVVQYHNKCELFMHFHILFCFWQDTRIECESVMMNLLALGVMVVLCNITHTLNNRGHRLNKFDSNVASAYKVVFYVVLLLCYPSFNENNKMH